MSADERRLREEETRRYVRAPYLADFDREFYAEFGQYPRESPLYGTAGPAPTARRDRIMALVTGGATEGERSAAAAALSRFDASHAEQDAMQRAGNHIGEL